MKKIPRCFYILCVFFEFLLLITGTRGTSSRMSALEGDDVKLRFPYPCESTKVTLQLRNRHPLFSSLNPNSLNLHFDQIGRLTVANVSENGECSIRLNISHVRLSDAGPYFLFAYNRDQTTTIMLYVDFPTGKTYCRWNGWLHEGYGVKLLCTTPIGRLPRQVQCYQGGMGMAPLSKPSETDTVIEQTILVLHNRHHVFCCSSTLLEPKGLCECNDFVWDPISNLEAITVDPCPAIITFTGQTDATEQATKQALTLPAAPTSMKSFDNVGALNFDEYTTAMVVIFTILMIITIIVIIGLVLTKIVTKCTTCTFVNPRSCNTTVRLSEGRVYQECNTSLGIQSTKV